MFGWRNLLNSPPKQQEDILRTVRGEPMMKSDIEDSNWENSQSYDISNMCFKWEGAFTRLWIRIRKRAYAENSSTIPFQM
jgi:hypothetical protein